MKTLQEKMAEKIGRNVEEEREKGRQVIADSEKEMRQNYLIAAMAVVLALGIFTEEKLNPVNPLALMRMLEERSVPVSSVGNGTPSVLEFYAPWCESCKLMARDMFELEGRYVGAVNFVTVNSEEADYDLLDRYDVTGVPTVVFADKDGKVITNLIGKIPRGILEQDFDALMRSKPLPYTADVDDEENMALFPADNGVQEIKSSSF